MQALTNYFLPKPTMTDVIIYITRGNTMTTVRLSYVKQLTDQKELLQLREDIGIHIMETFDEEECENGNIILEEIEKKLNAQ